MIMEQITMEKIDVIKNELMDYVKENTFKETDTLANETMLFVEGIFDSMGFVLLLDYLQENFSIEANDDDLVEDNFESINAIANFIASKKPSLLE
jgi:acyl carrier protein